MLLFTLAVSVFAGVLFGLLPALQISKANVASTLRTFYDQLIERLEAVPGMQAAGVTGVLPFSGCWWTSSFTVEGYQPGEGDPLPGVISAS